VSLSGSICVVKILLIRLYCVPFYSNRLLSKLYFHIFVFINYRILYRTLIDFLSFIWVIHFYEFQFNLFSLPFEIVTMSNYCFLINGFIVTMYRHSIIYYYWT